MLVYFFETCNLFYLMKILWKLQESKKIYSEKRMGDFSLNRYLSSRANKNKYRNLKKSTNIRKNNLETVFLYEGICKNLRNLFKYWNLSQFLCIKIKYNNYKISELILHFRAKIVTKHYFKTLSGLYNYHHTLSHYLDSLSYKAIESAKSCFPK